jgi:plasmid stabilization system protein ParE
MPPVEFLPSARRDFDESFDWYAARSPQAAMGFMDAVDAAVAAILADPMRYENLDGLHHACRVANYPFRIVYRMATDRVIVVAVAHAKRRPSYWTNRD